MMKYSEATVVLLNEFWRICALVISDLNKTVVMGNKYIRHFQKLKYEKGCAEVKKDVDDMQKLIDQARDGKEIIERMVEEGQPERVIEIKMVELTVGMMREQELQLKVTIENMNKYGGNI